MYVYICIYVYVYIYIKEKTRRSSSDGNWVQNATKDMLITPASLWSLNIASMEHGPFIDDLPIQIGDFP